MGALWLGSIERVPFLFVKRPVDPEAPLAVHCASGYRSVIACSLLRRAGMQNVINVVGGFDAWKKAGLEVEKAEAATVS